MDERRCGVLLVVWCTVQTVQTAIVIWNSGRVDSSYSGIAYFPGIAVVELKP
jgi:hypothetical protein